MQMINRLILILLIFFLNFKNLEAEIPYVFKTKSIQIINNGELVVANDGSVISVDGDLELTADKFEYSKFSKKLEINDNANIIIKSKNLKINFDSGYINQNEFIFKSNEKVELQDIKNNIQIISKKIIFDRKNNTVSSTIKSKIYDNNGNQSNVDSFTYHIDKQLLKVKNLNFLDKDKNNLKLSIAYLNTQTKNLFGKDLIFNLNNQNLINQNNEPRIKGRSIIKNDDYSEIKKGIFTTCKKTDNCPPWEISAEKIIHDKKKKVIKYENSRLKIYDNTLLYLPKFQHPDPTAERQSGFLVPSLRTSSVDKNYVSLPYYLVLSDNKDMTFSPRFYNDTEFLIQSEYRQANYNSKHISDFSFKFDENMKVRNHFFYKYDNQLNLDNFIASNLNLNIQTTSKDTYLRKNRIKSELAFNENILENSAKIYLEKNNSITSIETYVYEDMNKNNSDQFQYILPKINLNKVYSDFNDFDGNLVLNSDFMINKYDTNVLEKTNINNIVLSSLTNISNNRFLNDYKVIVKNTNSDAKNSKSYKNKTDNFISGLFQLNTSMPLRKDNEKFTKYFSPKISLKVAPKHNKNVSSDYVKLDVDSIFNTNRIEKNDVVEGGISLTYGSSYSILDKKNSNEIFGFKFANNLRMQEDNDLTRSSQLGQQVSSFFNEINFNPIEYLNLRYNSSIKNNFKDINYENFISDFNFGSLNIGFDYLNQNESYDDHSYLTNNVGIMINDFNKISFSTRKNKTKNLTEFYNFEYEYLNDCLSASILFNKEYYQDRDIKPSNSLFFKFTIIPTTENFNYSKFN